MRFIDEAIIKVSGGHGGPGAVSFRREVFIPRGGPDGGDGGEGGSISFIATHQLGTLQDFRFRRVYQATAGSNGSGANKAGKDGQDVLIRVPIGTTLKDSVTGELLVDFTEDGQTWVACKGGRGGKGNAHFVSSTFQAPRFAQPGEEGETRELKVELRLIADVGIIGFPNAGKSTLISRVSAARPKIADYAFTTLTPNLGVVQLQDLQTFVVADIPGLVEGAHRGEGLGHKFLKHIERTRLFVHLLDGGAFLEDATLPESFGAGAESQPGPSSFDIAVDNLVKRYETIRNELGLFSENLLHKPEIVVLNKLDALESDPGLVDRACKALRQRIAGIRGVNPIPGEPFAVSAVSGKGVNELIYVLHRELLAQAPREGTPVDYVRLPDDAQIRH
jgi:GTP-binding protein